jgi:hypothetical protein
MAMTAIAFASCKSATGSHELTSEEAAVTANNVREFASNVAKDVTERGPIAWGDHFANTPTFFMASEGRLVFQNGEDAVRGIQDLTRTIAHIELHWGEPVRVDPLTPTLAVLGMPWREIIVDTAGHRVEESGYFTGLAELGPAGWKFRDAHWSEVPSASPAP